MTSSLVKFILYYGMEEACGSPLRLRAAVYSDGKKLDDILIETPMAGNSAKYGLLH